nr:MAG TPA: hypothetical protein [Caudoviricetes sp.]
MNPWNTAQRRNRITTFGRRNRITTFDFRLSTFDFESLEHRAGEPGIFIAQNW